MDLMDLNDVINGVITAIKALIVLTIAGIAFILSLFIILKFAEWLWKVLGL